MSDINRLRQEALKLHKAVSNKIQRIKRNTGADVSNTQFDPRRDASQLSRANGATLRKAIAEMTPFMSRTNQFVSGDAGAPIPRNIARSFEKTQREYREAGNAHANSIGDIQTPSGLSVRQNQAMIPQSQGSAVFGPYKQYDFSASDFTSADAMKEMESSLKNKMLAKYLPEKLQAGRDNLNKALEYLGANEFIDQVNNLSDFQFDVMWYGTTVAESVFMQYGIEKERAAGTHKERWQDKVVESAANELGTVLEWASNEVPRERPQNTPQKRRGR